VFALFLLACCFTLHIIVELDLDRFSSSNRNSVHTLFIFHWIFLSRTCIYFISFVLINKKSFLNLYIFCETLSVYGSHLTLHLNLIPVLFLFISNIPNDDDFYWLPFELLVVNNCFIQVNYYLNVVDFNDHFVDSIIND